MIAMAFAVVLVGVAVMAVRELHREGHLPTRAQVARWWRFWNSGGDDEQ